MADFPTSIKLFTNLTENSEMNASGIEGDVVINNIQNEIVALQTKVGIDSSVNTASIDYKLKNASSSNPGHKHTLAQGATDVTASAAELNVLDGVTATTTELNHTDGVTSAIQTQLDGKAATSHNHSASEITSGTVATARLGSGTANSSTFLRGDQTYATPTATTTHLTTTAKASITQTGAQSIADTTDTKINFDNEIFDPGNNFDLTTDQFTAPVTGYYSVAGGVHMASSIADLHCYLVVAGTSSGSYMGTRNTGQSASVSRIIHMTATDTLELHAWQGSGGAVNTSNAYNSPFLSVHLISV